MLINGQGRRVEGLYQVLRTKLDVFSAELAESLHPCTHGRPSRVREVASV